MLLDERNTEFQHKPLSRSSPHPDTKTIAIRLLYLHPALSGNALIGSIIECENDQSYEALSYCWGPAPTSNDSDFISIVENNQYRTLKIRSNLASALRRLRYDTGRFRRLWIDAICIDQTNEAEKSEQIPLMDKIFQGAFRVCIWLGDEESDTDMIARDHIQEIIKLQGFESLIHSKYADEWAALASLMRREWFSRRWVVQEIAYAREATVYWGSQEIDWKELADAIALFGSKATQIAELFRQEGKYNNRADFLGDVEALSANRLVQTIGKVFRKTDNGQRVEPLLSLEALISNLSAFNASRPHDIIYAVLSLAKNTITSSTEPRKIPDHSSRRLSISAPRFGVSPPQVPPNAVEFLLDTQQPVMSSKSAVPTSPTRDSGLAGLLDMMPGTLEEARPRIREHGFDDAEIFRAENRLRKHIEASSTPFKYDEMVNKLELDNDPSLIIRKRFWDPESIQLMIHGPSGFAAMTLKLLLIERDNQFIVKDFLLALRERVKVKTFHVDYQKKFYEVCKDFINFTIRSSRSLDMLCRPWAPDNEDLPEADRGERDLPSWICTLSKSPFLPRPDGNFGRVNADLLVGMPDAGGTIYTTAASTIPEQYFFGGEGQRRLFVTGLQIDTIRETATEAVEGNIPSAWLKLGGWEDTTFPPPESFWRTIVADRNEHGQNPPSYYQRACQYAFQQRTVKGSLNTDRLINAKISQIMTDYLKRVQAVVFMRKLIRTQHGESDMQRDESSQKVVNGDGRIMTNQKPTGKGRLGLVPHDAKVGDTICMLRGCSVPVVLRVLDDVQPAKDRETQRQLRRHKSQATGTEWDHMVCKLIGECYIHGIMDGEVFRMREERGLHDTIFEIH